MARTLARAACGNIVAARRGDARAASRGQAVPKSSPGLRSAVQLTFAIFILPFDGCL